MPSYDVDMSGKRYERQEPGKRRYKSSVATMVGESLSRKLGKKEPKSKRKPFARSRSFAPKAMARYERQQYQSGYEYIEDITFFDTDFPTSSKTQGRVPQRKPLRAERQRGQRSAVQRSVAPSDRGQPSTEDSGVSIVRRDKPRMNDGEDEVDLVPDWLENVYNNSDRHSVGMGLLTKLFGSGDGRDIDFKEDRDSRPFFTYWVTIIQIILYIVAAVTYGIAPIGLDKQEVAAEVLMTNLAIERQSYLGETNLWVGPRQEDLIHIGAKYSPCMRSDENQDAALEAAKAVENTTACCIYNDGSGCVQSLENECSKSLATWYKWNENFKGYQNRISGSVCGQDPQYCGKPVSSGADIWPDDITEWPICLEPLNVSSTSTNYHMTCEVVGRPCCIGIQGECIIATKEYCDFRRGYFHQSEALCSQVKCLEEVCGMLPFVDPDVPDQFYRLFTSLFIHAGIIDLLITVVFQLLFMRDLEKIIGTWRIIIVYIGSGIAGSLASAIFIPYHVEAGPSGSTFGIIASLLIELIRLEKGATNRWKVAGKFLGCLLVLFLVGMILPQIDNWSHLFGLFFGGLMSVAMRPYKTMCDKPQITGTKVLCILLCLVLAIGIFVFLIILFYVVPVYECEPCMYFNCIPFTSTYCDNMAVNITRQTTAIIKL